MMAEGGQRAALRRLLAVLRRAFGAMARAEAGIERKGYDARRRYAALTHAGQRLSARIAVVEALIDPPEVVTRSMLGQAADLAPAPGDLPTRGQCAAAADPGRQMRGWVRQRSCDLDQWL